VYCFCKEFLLKPGTYHNPFDSTRTTGIVCDFTQPGWYGGMVYCGKGYYFDPYKRHCTDVPQTKIPYRSAYKFLAACLPRLPWALPNYVRCTA
jgi:hypothetical protein